MFTSSIRLRNPRRRAIRKGKLDRPASNLHRCAVSGFGQHGILLRHRLRAGIIQLEYALHEYGAAVAAADADEVDSSDIVEIILDLDEIEPLDDEEVILLETPTRPRFATDLGIGRASLPGMPPPH